MKSGINIFNLKHNFNNWLLLFVFLSLAPFIILSFFVHPHYDEYYFIDALSGRNIYEATAYWYNNWSGRFSSFFLCNILTYGTTNILIYRFYPIILMGLYVITFYLFFKSILKNIIAKNKLVLLSLFFLVLYIYKMPEVTTGFYYMICAYICDTGMLAFILLLVVLYKLLDDSVPKKGLYILLGCFLSLYIGGAYEPVMAMANTFMCLACILLMYYKNSNLKWFILIEIFLLISTFILVVAPGNKVRGGADLLSIHERGIVQIAIATCYQAFTMITVTLQNPLLIICLLLFIPLAKKIAKTNNSFYLNLHPLVAIIGVFIVTAASYFPAVWANTIPARIANQIYLFDILGLFFIMQLIVTYLLKKEMQIGINNNLSSLLKILMIICLIPSLSNKNIGRAYSDLTKAPEYSKKLNERYAYIKEEKRKGTKTVKISALFSDPHSYPLTIYYNYQELDSNKNDPINIMYAKYWGVDSIMMINKESIELLAKTRTN